MGRKNRMFTYRQSISTFAREAEFFMRAGSVSESQVNSLKTHVRSCR